MAPKTSLRQIESSKFWTVASAFLRAMATCALVAWVATPAEAKTDRDAYFQAAHRHSLYLIHKLAQEIDADLSANERIYLKKVIAESRAFLFDMKLEFEEGGERFHLDPRQPARSAVTDRYWPHPVYLNRSILNSPATQMNFLDAFQLFFHEINHKFSGYSFNTIIFDDQPVPPEVQSFIDSLGAKLRKALEKYHRVVMLPNGVTLETVNLPAEQNLKEFFDLDGLKPWKLNGLDHPNYETLQWQLLAFLTSPAQGTRDITAEIFQAMQHSTLLTSVGAEGTKMDGVHWEDESKRRTSYKNLEIQQELRSGTAPALTLSLTRQDFLHQDRSRSSLEFLQWQMSFDTDGSNRAQREFRFAINYDKSGFRSVERIEPLAIDPRWSAHLLKSTADASKVEAEVELVHRDSERIPEAVIARIQTTSGAIEIPAEIEKREGKWIAKIHHSFASKMTVESGLFAQIEVHSSGRKNLVDLDRSVSLTWTAADSKTKIRRARMTAKNVLVVEVETTTPLQQLNVRVESVHNRLEDTFRGGNTARFRRRDEEVIRYFGSQMKQKIVGGRTYVAVQVDSKLRPVQPMKDPIAQIVPTAEGFDYIDSGIRFETDSGDRQVTEIEARTTSFAKATFAPKLKKFMPERLRRAVICIEAF